MTFENGNNFDSRAPRGSHASPGGYEAGQYKVPGYLGPDGPVGSGNSHSGYSFDPMDGGNYRRVRKKHKKSHKGLKIAACVIAVLLVACAGFGTALAFSAKDLKDQASVALTDVNAVQSAIAANDYDKAATAAESLSASAEKLNQGLSSPLWGIASWVPVVGSDIRGVQTMASVLVDASDNALVPLTKALQATPPSSLVGADGSLNVQAVSSLMGAVQTAAPAMQRCATALDQVPTMNISQLEEVMGPAKEKLVGVNDAFQQANAFAPIIATVLGAEGDRAYLIAAQNSAEIRSSGGFPGSCGTLKISNGKIELGEFASVYDVLNEATPASCSVTQQESDLFDGFINVTWDAGFDPDFTRVAQIWAASYEERNSAHLDGVISITPSIVQDLLKLTGSITLADGTTLDGTNATKVLQSDLYWKYLAAGTMASGNGDLVDGLFAQAAGLAFDKVLGNMNSGTMMKMASVLGEGLSDRRIMMWLSSESEQSQIESLGVSGALNSDSKNPELGVFFGLWMGSKLGWYVDIDTQVGQATKNADGTTSYQVTSTFSNTVTQSALASGGAYIMGSPEAGFTQGDMAPYIYITAPAGGSISNMTASNGQSFAETEYRGVQVLSMKRESLKPGASITCTYTVTTAADAEAALDVATTPTLTQYR